MAEQVAHIFHVKRKDGSSIFLHPFGSPERTVQLLGSAQITARYGAEPRVEALTMLRNDLYRLVEAAVKNWISELRFIPRFLFATGAFLLAYFIASYVIRDPLPVIDEIAISVGAAILVYVLLGRRYRASTEAMKKRVQLRAAVDRIAFTQSEFVRRVEAALHENEANDVQSVVRKIVSPDRGELGSPEREEAEQFVRLLEHQFDLKKLRREERVLRKFVERGERTAESQSIRRWLESRKLDAPLYALYKSYKRTVQAQR